MKINIPRISNIQKIKENLMEAYELSASQGLFLNETEQTIFLSMVEELCEKTEEDIVEFDTNDEEAEAFENLFPDMPDFPNIFKLGGNVCKNK